jgi:cytochrome o ubiquinol oxidase subunit IV
MNHRTEYQRELRSYLVGLGLAIALSAIAFACVAWGTWARATDLWVIAVTAIVQMIVHFRYFLHINLSQSKRDDLQLILFSLLIIILMVGGTIWILENQRERMM